MKTKALSFDMMDNSEQTPYNRCGLKLYCKKDHGNPIQFPKPDSKKNIVKSKSGSTRSQKNGKKKQFWKYDDRHIDQYDLSEFHPECEFFYESTWHPTTCWVDDWENPYEYMLDEHYAFLRRERYQHTPNLDAGWLDCGCPGCGGCMYPKQNHICIKTLSCHCHPKPKITTIDLDNGGQYDWESSSDDDQDESWSEQQKRTTIYNDDDEAFNSCWGCYRKTCLTCNPPNTIDSDGECGDPRCRECYDRFEGDRYRWAY